MAPDLVIRRYADAGDPVTEDPALGAEGRARGATWGPIGREKDLDLPRVDRSGGTGIRGAAGRRTAGDQKRRGEGRG